ncbi:hypothetical protein ACFZCV_14555 [Streptomyces sp. NPDC007920]|uniref:hypothetical protein n=1 Tax=Streptomyces sp. NPDC007920 TaxID=3364794 RepID=UPI0036EE984E
MNLRHSSPHPLAGQVVTVAPAAQLHGFPDATPLQFKVEDWNDRVFGGQWWGAMDGNPAALSYAMRSAVGGLPTDNEVVYGHVGGRGHLVHVSEIQGGDES